MALSQTIKKLAQQANEAGTPAAFLYADVIQASPLRVFVDNRFELDGSFLVVPEHMQYKAVDLNHNHEISGQTTENALSVLVVQPGISVGDKLILFRNQGGEEYLVIGKVG